MPPFALVCDSSGVIKNIVGDACVFSDTINQLFPTNSRMVDVKKALNFFFCD